MNGDTVLVADGTYTGNGNRDIDFNGKNIAVISSHGAASTIIDCGGFASTDNSGNHRGFYIHSSETAAVINGFTIKNGSETGNSAFALLGGGICIDGGSAVIRNCIVTSNAVRDNGGGISVTNGVATIENCTAIGNTAGTSPTNSGSSGGGIYNNGTLRLIGCTVTSNQASFGGVGNDGVLTMTNCVVSDNTVYDTGGGIINGGGLTLTNCTISGNRMTTSGSRGGGIYNYGTANLTNCLLTRNTAQDGAGFYNVNNSGAVTLTNCTVAQNNGSGVYNDTFAASSDGGAMTLTNDIVYGNVNGGVITGGYSTSVATAANSDIQSGYPGTGNIDANPLFVNASGGDFHLLPGSPCLGAGTSTGAPATDKSGRTRPNPPSIGAYELVPPSVSHILWRSTDGTQSLWTVTPDFNYTFRYFGPFPGWTGTALSAGPDGRLHLLWNHAPDSKMSLWAINAAGSSSYKEYGPYTGWTAKGVATGGDGVTDVYWTQASGLVSSWRVSEADGSFTHFEYGPYSGWTANALAAGPDGRASLAWSKTDGTQSLWNADFGSGTFSFRYYGP